MAVGGEKAKELIFIALGKKDQGYLLLGIGLVDFLKSLRVALAYHGMNVWCKAPFIKPVDRLWREQQQISVIALGIGIGKKVGEEHDGIEKD